MHEGGGCRSHRRASKENTNCLFHVFPCKIVVVKTANLSTVIENNVKRAVMEFCKKRGFKIRYIVEQALLEYLENEIDIEAYHSRKNEETVSLEEILSQIKRA